jgi:hypothetical protein
MSEANTLTTRKLSVDGNYKCFSDFYSENKEVIYKNLITLFRNFKKKDKLKVTLNLNAKINGLEWGTELSFTRNDFHILKRDIMPYFEEIEDYETCAKICNLYDTLILI